MSEAQTKMTHPKARIAFLVLIPSLYSYLTLVKFVAVIVAVISPLFAATGFTQRKPK
jgi:hypothetical protein